jgi:hypothetical protein
MLRRNSKEAGDFDARLGAGCWKRTCHVGGLRKAAAAGTFALGLFGASTSAALANTPSGRSARQPDSGSTLRHSAPWAPGAFRLGHIAVPKVKHPLTVVGASSAVQTANPIGVPIDTIKMQGRSYGAQIGSDWVNFADSDALQLVVLNRSNLNLIEDDAFSNDETGATALLAKVQSLPNSDLLILSKPDPTLTNATDSSSAATINEALAAIGAKPVPADVSTGDTPYSESGGCSSFSAIGISGLPVGQGTVNACVAGTDQTGQEGGDIHGTLRPDINRDAYTFVSDQRIPFDTGDPTSDPAVVTVGDNEDGSSLPKQTYTSANLNGGAGFFVLVLDSGNLQRFDQYTFPATDEGLYNMATVLGGWAGNPNAEVIVRSIGHVSPVSSSGTGQPGGWDAVATQLKALGGSKYYFDALDGTDAGYAQVGPANSPAFPSNFTQVASSERNGTARLTGLLARNDLSELYPDESVPQDLKDQSRPLAGTLPGILSLPTSAWPDRDTVAERNAIACIAKHIDGSVTLDPVIQDNYTNTNLVSNWAGWASTIQNTGYYNTLESYGDCSSFSQTDYTTVSKQLYAEFTAVPEVLNMVNNLEAPLVAAQGGTDTSIGQITDAVDKSVNDDDQAATYDLGGLSSNLLWMISGLPGIGEFADVANLLAGTMATLDSLNVQSDGTNETMEEIQAKGDELGSDIQARLTDSINNLNEVGTILVSDWTKLQDAAENAVASSTDPNAAPNAAAYWGFTPAANAEAVSDLEVSAKRTAYEALFPAAYNLYDLSNIGAPSTPVDPADYPCTIAQENSEHTGTFLDNWTPFSSIPTNYDSQTPVVSGEGNKDGWTYAGADDDFLQDSSIYGSFPTQDLLDGMFTPYTVGSQTMPALFTPLQFAVEAYGDASRNTTLVTHIKVNASKQSSDTGCLATGSISSGSKPTSGQRGQERTSPKGVHPASIAHVSRTSH